MKKGGQKRQRRLRDEIQLCVPPAHFKRFRSARRWLEFVEYLWRKETRRLPRKYFNWWSLDFIVHTFAKRVRWPPIYTVAGIKSGCRLILMKLTSPWHWNFSGSWISPTRVQQLLGETQVQGYNMLGFRHRKEYSSNRSVRIKFFLWFPAPAPCIIC